MSLLSEARNREDWIRICGVVLAGSCPACTVKMEDNEEEPGWPLRCPCCRLRLRVVMWTPEWLQVDIQGPCVEMRPAESQAACEHWKKSTATFKKRDVAAERKRVREDLRRSLGR